MAEPWSSRASSTIDMPAMPGPSAHCRVQPMSAMRGLGEPSPDAPRNARATQPSSPSPAPPDPSAAPPTTRPAPAAAITSEGWGPLVLHARAVCAAARAAVAP